jgi:hypothetical protein
MKTITEFPEKEMKKQEIVKFLSSDVEALMDRHGIEEDAKSIMRNENLIPTSLLVGCTTIFLSIPY